MWASASISSRQPPDSNNNNTHSNQFRGPRSGNSGNTFNNGNGTDFPSDKPSATSKFVAAIHNRFPALVGISDGLVASSGNNKLLSSILSSQSSRGAPGKMSMSEDTKKWSGSYGSPTTHTGGFGGGGGGGRASGGGGVGGPVAGTTRENDTIGSNQHPDSEGTTTIVTDESRLGAATRFKASPGPPPQITPVDEEKGNAGLSGLEEEMRAHMRGREF